MEEHGRPTAGRARRHAHRWGDAPRRPSAAGAVRSAWPGLFEREAARIRALLGEQALGLEHVGSTSVPGLLAKPIIDIVLAVRDSADESAYVPALEAVGYRLVIREPGWHEHRVLKGPDTNINLHVFTHGSSEIGRMVAFRDRLRAHEDERAAYAAVKQELAARSWAFVQDYADAKSSIVEAIVARALADEPA
jgi:GrpB-like predicted nucleotidyltransferase (UPF0157 family)